MLKGEFPMSVANLNTGERIKYYRKESRLTQKQLADKVSLTPQVISNIERNYTSVSSEDLAKIASVLEVSTDDLLSNEKSSQQEKSYYELSDKEKSDIAVQADQLLEGIESGDDLSFYGEPATEEQKERLRIAIRTAMEMNKEEAKKKFTPKKYRD
ncbi:MAG: helix-turn-helix domain-containing protein [Tetragenococcus koreensis]|nr:helix-turn-helix domain-containing protein [Tetragenococcus koreensis]